MACSYSQSQKPTLSAEEIWIEVGEEEAEEEEI